MDGHPGLEEVRHLNATLSPAERDELLQCQLIAATRGEGAVIEMLGDLFLCHATEELPEEHQEETQKTGDERIVVQRSMGDDQSWKRGSGSCTAMRDFLLHRMATTVIVVVSWIVMSWPSWRRTVGRRSWTDEADAR